MENSILVTTTNTIENAEIVKYIDLISTNVVVGTNFFSDFGASLTDLFGGYSDTYQNKLQEIYKIAIDNLKNRAMLIGANAIVGLKIDFDEISGKGKSMFMISALGTAVVINDGKNRTQNSMLDIVGNDRLNKEIIKVEIQNRLTNNRPPLIAHWEYLLTNPNDEIVDALVEIYTSQDMEGSEFEKNIPTYLSKCNSDIVSDALYSRLYSDSNNIFDLIGVLKLFSPKHIYNMFAENNITQAIMCLALEKKYYSTEDIKDMNQIVTFIDGLPDLGKIDTVKGLLSKAKEKFICPNGHNNDLPDTYCSQCGMNIKGLTQSENDIINEYKHRLSILSSLISK